jgi:acyl-CoA thioesterase
VTEAVAGAAAALKVGFLGHIGVRMEQLGGGTSTASLVAAAEHLNPQGAIHGGVSYSLADTGMGAALTSVLGPAERCATIEIKMVYIAAGREGALTCESKVIHKGRTTAVMESEVRQGDRLVAKALGTFAILERRTG